MLSASVGSPIWACHLAQSEIHYDGAALGGDHDIGRFDVAMDGTSLFGRGLDEVDSAPAQGIVACPNPFQDQTLFATAGRYFPQGYGTREGESALKKIHESPVRRLERDCPSAFGDLFRPTSGRRYPENLVPPGAIRVEIDPVAVGGPTGHLLIAGVIRHAQGRTAEAANHLDIEIASRGGVKGDPSAVGRPAGHSGGNPVNDPKLLGAAPIRMADPDAQITATIGFEHKLLAVG